MFNFRKNTETDFNSAFHSYNDSMNFNNPIFDVTNSKPLWNPKSFALVSCLFSFLPAAIMYSINYKRLGVEQKGKKFIIASIIGLIVTMILLSFLPGTFGNTVAMVLNGAVGANLMNKQLPLYKEFIARGGRKASLFLPLTICIISTGILLIPIVYSANIPDSSLIFGDDDVYFTSNVNEDEVESLGQYLLEYEFFTEDGQTISLKLDKNFNDTYIVSVIIDEGYVEDEEVLQIFTDLGHDISQDVFNGKKVEIHFTNSRFKKLKVVNPQSIET